MVNKAQKPHLVRGGRPGGNVRCDDRRAEKVGLQFSEEECRSSKRWMWEKVYVYSVKRDESSKERKTVRG